jgi:hypothetical protein
MPKRQDIIDKSGLKVFTVVTFSDAAEKVKELLAANAG